MIKLKTALLNLNLAEVRGGDQAVVKENAGWQESYLSLEVALLGGCEAYTYTYFGP